MAAAIVTVDGVARTWRFGTLNIVENINRRSTCRVGITSTDGSYLPAQDDTVVVEDLLGNVLFAGHVRDPQEAWFKGTDAVVTVIDCWDHTAYAERRLINASVTAGLTGRDAIDLVVSGVLATYGVTRDPAMPAGATLGELSYEFATAMQVLNDIVKLAAPDHWVWRIDENKVLRAWEIGTEACPWALSGNDDPKIVGDIAIKRAAVQTYANTVYLVYGNGSSTPGIATATDAAEVAAVGPYDAVIRADGPFDSSTAQDVADAYLATLMQRPQQIEFSTLEPGARAGMTLSVTVPRRNLSGSFVITQVVTSDLADGQYLQYRITAVNATALPASWKDETTGGTSANSGLVVVGGGTSVPSTTSVVVALGGATAQAVVPGAGTWVAVVNAVPYVAAESRTVTVRVDLWTRNAGITVTARLYDRTTSVTVGTSTGVTGSTPTLVTFSASIVAGRRYELQVSADTADEGVYGIGSMELS